MKLRLIASLRWLAELAVLGGAVIACTLPAAYEYPGRARQALVTFFAQLSRGEYAQAAELYGGDYTQLEILGPDLDPADRAALWQNACEKSGLQCLPVASAAFVGSAGDIFAFTVEFRTPDGNVFALAPCCGEPGFLDPPMAGFVLRVGRTPEGAFVVLDLPIYQP
jgi:hypothetical protein